MQHRIDRINEEIKRVLADVIRELKDPRMGTLVSITAVDATSDLKQAKVFVSVLGDEKTSTEVLKVLKTAEGHIRRELGARVDLHFTPELLFELDNSIATGARIDAILKDINK